MKKKLMWCMDPHSFQFSLAHSLTHTSLGIIVFCFFALLLKKSNLSCRSSVVCKKAKNRSEVWKNNLSETKKYLSFSKGIRISRKYPDPKYPLFLFQSCCRTITLQRPKKGPNLSFFSFLPCNWVFFFLFCMVLIVVKKRVFLVCFYVLKLYLWMLYLNLCTWLGSGFLLICQNGFFIDLLIWGSGLILVFSKFSSWGIYHWFLCLSFVSFELVIWVLLVVLELDIKS